MEDFPDIIELNDWLLFNHPEVYTAIKYLHTDAWMECALKIWRMHEVA